MAPAHGLGAGVADSSGLSRRFREPSISRAGASASLGPSVRLSCTARRRCLPIATGTASSRRSRPPEPRATASSRARRASRAGLGARVGLTARLGGRVGEAVVDGERRRRVSDAAEPPAPARATDHATVPRTTGALSGMLQSFWSWHQAMQGRREPAYWPDGATEDAAARRVIAGQKPEELLEWAPGRCYTAPLPASLRVVRPERRLPARPPKTEGRSSRDEHCVRNLADARP